MNIPVQLLEPRALILLLTIPPVVALGILSMRARPRDRARITASVVLRASILAMIIFAVAGLQLATASGPLNVVFLVDESASVSQSNQDAATEYVKRAISAMGPNDRAGVVLFGERAVVARAVSGDTELQPFGEHPVSTATDTGQAIQTGSALFPEGGARRLVLLTDGAETAGDARSQARLAALSGVQLSVVPLGAQAANDAAVDRVSSPDAVPSGQKFTVSALVKSTSDRAATVRLLDNNAPAGEQQVNLKAGDNQVDFGVKASSEGFHVFTAQVISVDDRYPENNQASSFTMVRKPPTVLIIAGSPEDGTPLKQALSASGVRADVIAPDATPNEEQNLLEYDAVVLANVSAPALGTDAQQLLQHYVRDLGRGLVMLGGDLSYGAGGYLRSPVEDALPVTMDVKSSEQRASLAMAFVTDKSGSMGRCHCGDALRFSPTMRTEFGPSKVEIAKDAIAKAAGVLNSSDQVGVVAFDDTAHWIVNMQPMQSLGNGVLEQDLQPMQAEGNTNMYAGLQAAVDALGTTNAKLKHIILVSDGWTRQGDFSTVLGQIKADGITLSTVGDGQGAGDELKQLADQGGGRYYVATDVNTVPDIFLKETVQVVGSYFVEQPFRPQQARASPILAGIDTTQLPALLGYNASTLKSNAELILKSPAGDPILAQWQYGLGRSVAWTPDVKGRWATAWIQWPQFSRFAGQLIGWTMPGSDSPGLDTSFALASGSNPATQDASIRVDSSDASGAPRNFLDTTVVLTSTSGVTQTASLTQASPGVYQGRASGLDQGVYQAQVTQIDPTTGSTVAAAKTGVVIPYPSEFRISAGGAAASAALVNDLVQLGNGRVLDLSKPAEAFTHDISSQPEPVPLWPWLIGLAILLFPIDVAVRRLTITPSDLRAAIRMLARRSV